MQSRFIDICHSSISCHQQRLLFISFFNRTDLFCFFLLLLLPFLQQFNWNDERLWKFQIKVQFKYALWRTHALSVHLCDVSVVVWCRLSCGSCLHYRRRRCFLTAKTVVMMIMCPVLTRCTCCLFWYGPLRGDYLI